MKVQEKSHQANTLYLKYNWLNENDQWAISLKNHEQNGKLANLTDFVFDSEYCKPFIVDANERYFTKHPEAKNLYLKTRKTKEQLLKELEDKWKGMAVYKEAIRLLKSRKEKVLPYQYQSSGLWGFRYNSTTLIQPIFTERPIDLGNGYFQVKQGHTMGIVNYYAEKVLDWSILVCNKLKVDDYNQKVLYHTNEGWGISDLSGNSLVQPQFIDIEKWTGSAYRVKTEEGWKLFDISRGYITSCSYDSIGEIYENKAKATKRDATQHWVIVSGYIDI
ncbi:MAG: WG repeat-containing protein, partial [Alloprevotella sp.]|nr:WG repeat-containing protein [Prevotellamassilia sp.]MDY5761484.1 WG repeat-containing protein [Alloprevotella sp.]